MMFHLFNVGDTPPPFRELVARMSSEEFLWFSFGIFPSLFLSLSLSLSC